MGGELTAATRENHLQNRRATVLFPCSRLRPFNVNGAGNREYRGNRIFHGEKWTATMKKGEKYRSLRNWLFHGTRRIYFSYYADVGQNHAGFHPLWTLFIMKKRKKGKNEKRRKLFLSFPSSPNGFSVYFPVEIPENKLGNSNYFDLVSPRNEILEKNLSLSRSRD